MLLANAISMLSECNLCLQTKRRSWQRKQQAALLAVSSYCRRVAPLRKAKCPEQAYPAGIPNVGSNDLDQVSLGLRALGEQNRMMCLYVPLPKLQIKLRQSQFHASSTSSVPLLPQRANDVWYSMTWSDLDMSLASFLYMSHRQNYLQGWFSFWN